MHHLYRPQPKRHRPLAWILGGVIVTLFLCVSAVAVAGLIGDEPVSDVSTASPSPRPVNAAPTSPIATEWMAFARYTAGQIVTYKGKNYRVLEDHTSLPDWDPASVPALFEPLGGDTRPSRSSW